MNLVIRNFPSELHRELKVLAAKNSVTLSYLIISTLQLMIDKQTKEGK